MHNPHRSLFTTTLCSSLGLLTACTEEFTQDSETTTNETTDSDFFLDEEFAGASVKISPRALGAAEHEAARRGLDDAMRAAHLAAIDIDRLTADLESGSEVEFPLPEGEPAMLVVETVHELLPGITSFAGRLAGDAGADFTFSIADDGLVGAIRREQYVWLIEPDPGSGRHTVRMVDRTRLSKDRQENPHARDGADPESLGALAQPPAPPSTAMGTGDVRVLFLVASDVKAPNAKITNIATAFNQSLALSAVAANNRISIARVQPLASTLCGMGRFQIIEDMVARKPPFQHLDALRAGVSADIVFLLLEEQPVGCNTPAPDRAGGVAYVKAPVSASPFALSTSAYALGDLTALHEIGHVLGGHHENVSAADAGIARPVVSPDKKWMTVMGGYIECPFAGLGNPATCIRLNRWSNPDQTHLGVPLGVPGQRDMESHLEGQMPVASGWMPLPPTSQPLVERKPLVPLMAVYNDDVRDYLYSTDLSVINAAIANYGYNDLGGSYQTVGYVEATAQTNTAEFKRYWKDAPQTDHFYTTSASEASAVIQSGWVWEPQYSAGHLYTTQVPGSVPLYRLNKFTPNLDGMHYYTASTSEVNAKKAAGFTLDGVVGYLYTTATPTVTGGVVLGRRCPQQGNQQCGGATWRNYYFPWVFNRPSTILSNTSTTQRVKFDFTTWNFLKLGAGHLALILRSNSVGDFQDPGNGKPQGVGIILAGANCPGETYNRIAVELWWPGGGVVDCQSLSATKLQPGLQYKIEAWSSNNGELGYSIRKSNALLEQRVFNVKAKYEQASGLLYPQPDFSTKVNTPYVLIHASDALNDFTAYVQSLSAVWE